MPILFLKITKLFLGFAATIGLYVFLIFLLFFLSYSVWPNIVKSWGDAASNEHAIEQLNAEAKQIEGQVANAKKKQEGLKKIREQAKDSLVELRESIENNKESFSNWRKKQIENLAREIEDLKRQRPYFATLRGYPHDVQIKAKEVQLASLSTRSFTDPTVSRVATIGSKLTKAESGLKEIESHIKEFESQLSDKLHELNILQNDSSIITNIRSTWLKYWKSIAAIVVSIVFLPWIGKLIKFYPLAWMSTRQSAICFAESPTTTLLWAPPAKTVTVAVSPGEFFVARNGFIVAHAQGRKLTQFVWSWNAIATSCAAGLMFCTRVPNETNQTVSVSLSSSDPDLQITEIALRDNCEVVLHPNKIIAIKGEIVVRATWRLTSLHAWLTAQVRFLSFRGPGSIFLLGCGGVEGVFIKEGAQHLEQHLTVGFDSSLSYSARRTETLIPFLQGNARLFEDRFEGTGVYLRENASQPQRSTLTERSFGAILSIVGKFFGF